MSLVYVLFIMIGFGYLMSKIKEIQHEKNLFYIHFHDSQKRMEEIKRDTDEKFDELLEQLTKNKRTVL